MKMFERAVIHLVKKKLNRELNLDSVKTVPSDGLKEYRDIPYTNRSGKELLMDIYEPIVDDLRELPVVINIHGGGLIDGNKNLSEGFCRQLTKMLYAINERLLER